MRDSAIRHLAITDESAIVAAALFEKTVQIWSWKTGQHNASQPGSWSAGIRAAGLLALIRSLHWVANSGELCRLAEGLTRNQIE